MKQSRVKAVGLGLALLTGSLRAADGPTPAVSPAPAPALLPVSVRTPVDWAPTTGGGEFTPVWLPARRPVAADPQPPVAATAAPPATSPGKTFTWVKPAAGSVEPEPTVGPRPTPATPAFGPLPEIPTLPATPPAPVTTPAPAEPSQPSPRFTTSPEAQPVHAEPNGWQPVPRTAPVPSPLAAEPPVATPPVEVPPAAHLPVTHTPVEQPVPDPLPAPRRVPSSDSPPPAPPAPTAPAQAELPVAPPELMVPGGVAVPGRRGTFGSPPVNISRDYPPLRTLLTNDGSGEPGWWGRRAADQTGTPATDRLSFGVEYLLWWMNAQQIPVLASTSTAGGFGFLGSPDTRTLLGPGGYGDTLRSGMRARAGWWFDDCGTWGVDGSFFFLGHQATSTGFNSLTTPTITRPIFAPNFPGEYGEVVAQPGFSNGLLTIDAGSTLWGFDANIRRALCKTCEARAEVFAGYRFLGLNESLRVTEYITSLADNPNDPPGTNIVVQDRFDTKNRFNGGQVGVAGERTWGNLSLGGRASVALGSTQQTLDIAGGQFRLRPGMTTPDTFSGGLLATGPNLGRFTRDHFSVVPEATVNLGYALTPTLRAFVGYNFLYWTNVIRPGDQIDRVVDVTLVPNPPAGVAFSGQNRPQPTFKQSDIFVNGIQFGLSGRW